jgi:hypothetical protein
VLEHEFTTAHGSARVTDSLNSGISGRLPWSELARRIEGLTGAVEFHVEAVVGQRLDLATPWREPSPHGDVLHIDGIIAALRSSLDFERLVEDDRGVVGKLVTTPGSRSILAILASAHRPAYRSFGPSLARMVAQSRIRRPVCRGRPAQRARAQIIIIFTDRCHCGSSDDLAA